MLDRDDQKQKAKEKKNLFCGLTKPQAAAPCSWICYGEICLW